MGPQSSLENLYQLSEASLLAILASSGMASDPWTEDEGHVVLHKPRVAFSAHTGIPCTQLTERIATE